jgi:AraC-like DNA-binding protein
MKDLVDWRMTLARDLLLTQNLPMTEIADRIGYSSPYAFASAFRRQHGQPPGRWRQQQASTGFAGILRH